MEKYRRSISKILEEAGFEGVGKDFEEKMVGVLDQDREPEVVASKIMEELFNVEEERKIKDQKNFQETFNLDKKVIKMPLWFFQINSFNYNPSEKRLILNFVPMKNIRKKIRKGMHEDVDYFLQLTDEVNQEEFHLKKTFGLLDEEKEVYNIAVEEFVEMEKMIGFGMRKNKIYKEIEKLTARKMKELRK